MAESQNSVLAAVELVDVIRLVVFVVEEIVLGLQVLGLLDSSGARLKLQQLSQGLSFGTVQGGQQKVQILDCVFHVQRRLLRGLGVREVLDWQRLSFAPLSLVIVALLVKLVTVQKPILHRTHRLLNVLICTVNVHRVLCVVENRVACYLKKPSP